MNNQSRFRVNGQPPSHQIIFMALLVTVIITLALLSFHCAPTAIQRQFGLYEQIRVPDGCHVLDSIIEWNEYGGVVKRVWMECR